MSDAKKLGDAITSAGFEFTDIIESDGILAVVGFTSSPKQSGPSKISGHSVPPGKSIVEKIRDDLDETYAAMVKEINDGGAEVFIYQHLGEGIAHALGVLRSSSADHEWEEAVQRYGRRRSTTSQTTPEGFDSRNSTAV